MANIEATADFLGVTPQTVSTWQADQAQVPDDTANLDQVRTIARWLARKYDSFLRTSAPQFSQKILDRGFIAGLIFCAFAFLALVVYLFCFMLNVGSSLASANSTGETAIHSQFTLVAKLMTVKLALLSCGIMAGAALAFLGLSLFLLGIRSVMNVDASGGSFQAKLVNVAPGTLILLCSTLLIGIVTTREFTIDQSREGSPPTDAKTGDSAKAGEKPSPGKESSKTSIKFAASVDLVTRLRRTITEAEAQAGEKQKCLLENVWYLADNMPPLINDYKSSLDASIPTNPRAIRQLDAMKTHLTTIAQAEQQYRAQPREAIQKMKDALKLLEAELNNLNEESAALAK